MIPQLKLIYYYYSYIHVTIMLNISTEDQVPKKPPAIYSQPNKVEYFKPGEPIKLQCQATGIPEPT